MTRLFVVLGLLGALVGLAICEQLYIDRAFDKMRAETTALIEAVHGTPFDDDNKGTFDDYVKARIDELHKYWIKKERKMCVFMRHMELSYVSDALIYARNFIHFDNQEEAMAGLARLEYLLDAYSQIYGLNVLNIL